MNHIKHHTQLRAEKQRLKEQRIRLEEKMNHDCKDLKRRVASITNPISTVYQLINGKWTRLIQGRLKKWFQ